MEDAGVENGGRRRGGQPGAESRSLSPLSRRPSGRRRRPNASPRGHSHRRWRVGQPSGRARSKVPRSPAAVHISPLRRPTSSHRVGTPTTLAHFVAVITVPSPGSRGHPRARIRCRRARDPLPRLRATPARRRSRAVATLLRRRIRALCRDAHRGRQASPRDPRDRGHVEITARRRPPSTHRCRPLHRTPAPTRRLRPSPGPAGLPLPRSSTTSARCRRPTSSR
jgi:hypothetical protein